MVVRCYIPTTVSALESDLFTMSGVTAVAPDAAARSLRGEDLEGVEFEALCIAAELATDQALTRRSPRAVVSYDAEDSGPVDQIAEGFELRGLSIVDLDRVASIHLDDPEDWQQALNLVNAGTDSGAFDAARDYLGESDLLWFDVSELPNILAGE